MRFGAGLLVVCFIACASEGKRDEAAPRPAAAPAGEEPPGASPLHLEARRRVSWGYGCGGNCAQNTRGTSTVIVNATSSGLEVEDAGDTATTFSSPGTLTTAARHWKLAWRGALDDGDTAMTLRLSSGSGTCEESEGKGSVPCKHPVPSRLVVACTRDQVEIDSARRAVWRCQPDPAIPAAEWSGTPFPWIFGIDDPIDTLHAGEPEPRTSYHVRAPE